MSDWSSDGGSTELQPSRIFDPQVVGMSVVVNTSLSASGTPASGDGSCSPAATLASIAAAAASARSPATRRKAWMIGSASCRERACQTVYTTAVVGTLTYKPITTQKTSNTH